MKIVIVMNGGRLAATVEDSPRDEPRELLASTLVDPRAAEQTAALVSRLVGISIVDAIAREAGGGDGA